MKRILTSAVIAFALCGFTAQAQEAAPATETPAAAPAAATPAIAAELTQTLDELTAVLASITDKESADAAAPKLKEMMAKFDAMESKMEEMDSQLTDEQKMTVGLTLLAKMGALAGHMERIEAADFYGSEILKAIEADDEEEGEEQAAE